MDVLWIGPRESDIIDVDLFCASITIFGNNQGNNYSYSKCQHTRIDHNQPNCISDTYNIEMLEKLVDKYPSLKIMYYNSIFSKYVPDKHRARIIGNNDMSILELLDSKIDVRRLAARTIPVVPFQEISSVDQLKNYITKIESDTQYILQENHASGGYGTHIINKNNMSLYINNFDFNKGYFISPYYEKSISVNAHCILFDNEVIVCPGSIQLVKVINNKISYLGSDFVEYHTLPDKEKELLKKYSKQFCEVIRDMGYRGVLGIDFLIINNEPHLLEINGRFQASTPLLNKALKDNGLPSMQELHLMACNKQKSINIENVENLDIKYSLAAYTNETWKKSINLLKQPYPEKIVAIELNGYDPTETILNGAYLFHIIFHTNLCSINPDGGLWIYENIYDITDEFTNGIINKNPLNIKISLLNQGVRITEEARRYLINEGEIRNAVFSAVDITILDNLQINCPNDVKMVTFTPWTIDVIENKQLKLFYYKYEISNVTLDMADPHANRTTKSGLPYKRISFWATDRMRIHHTISCIFKNNNSGCRFCEIPPICNVLNIEDVYEVIDFYLTQNNTFRHFLIGGGSESFDQEAEHITQIVKHIRNQSNKPIYLMCLPPKDLSILDTWYRSGVTEISFNLELYDRELAKQYMPGKGSIPIEQYLYALKKAVSLWGKDGNVRTLFIAGLESKESLLKGIQVVSGLGVMPILSVFRALYDTDLENVVPPDNKWLLDLYQKGESICNHNNLHLGPSCPSCQNNTLSMPFQI